jgi:phosphoribosylanthranilate isomerase
MTVEAKICGINTVAGLGAAVDGGARYIGLVFVAKSPRHVDLATAAKLALLGRGRADVVALLVDPDDALVRDVVREVAPDVLQLHGSESPARVAEIKTLAGRPVIKAIGVAHKGDAESALLYVDVADSILFDAKSPKDATRTGGHGRTFDWSLLDGALRDRRWPQGKHWMLSGGLTPGNVADAIRQTGAPMVDVSSGVESAPGVKDAELIRRFLQAVKTAKQT